MRERAALKLSEAHRAAQPARKNVVNIEGKGREAWTLAGADRNRTGTVTAQFAGNEKGGHVGRPLNFKILRDLFGGGGEI